MEKISRICINAIKAAAIKNKGCAFNLAQAVRDAGIDISNPHIYSQDAMEELRKEGHWILKTTRGWHIAGIKSSDMLEEAVSTMENKMQNKVKNKTESKSGNKMEDSFKNIVKNMKEELEPVNSFENFPIEKKPQKEIKNEAKEIKIYDTSELNQKKPSESKAGLNFIDTEFDSIGHLVGLLSIF